MEKILESLWVLFVLLGGFLGSRLWGKIDSLEKEKADSSQTLEVEKYHAKLIH